MNGSSTIADVTTVAVLGPGEAIVLPFKSEFVDNPTNPNQFLKDPYLCEKLEEYGEAFMSILIHYYKKYSTDGLKEPKEVMKYTK